MKICLTEKEVEDIVLQHVQRLFGIDRPMAIRLNLYAEHYCVISEAPKPEPEEENG